MPYSDPERKRASDKARYERNRDHIISMQARRLADRTQERLIADRVKGQARMQKWREQNRERHLAYSRERERLRRAATSVIGDLQDLKTYIAILENDPCVYCGAPFEHLDHIDALSQGGTHEWDNLTSACADCNLRKYTHSLLEFMVRNGTS